MRTMRLQADACRHGNVDLADSEHPTEVLHVPADEFGAFVRRIKAGEYDHLCPPAAKGSHGADADTT